MIGQPITTGYQPDYCTCGHAEGDHRSNGAGWPHPRVAGVCLSRGCACKQFVARPVTDRDEYDALQDARAELVGDGVHMTTREAAAASLNCPRGNGDLYPRLRDSARHPFGLPSTHVPTDGHPAPATPSTGAPAPDGPRALSPGARADGAHLPDLAA